MTDLVSRLLEAIGETERRENSRFVGGWFLGDPCPVCGRPVDVVESDSVADREQVVVQPCGHRLTGDDLVAFQKPQPAPDLAVLRRCAADRRIVERFLLAASEYRPDAFRVMYETLLDVAEAYGLEVTE